MTDDSLFFDLQDLGQVCHEDIHRYLGMSHKAYIFWIMCVSHILLNRLGKRRLTISSDSCAFPIPVISSNFLNTSNHL